MANNGNVHLLNKIALIVEATEIPFEGNTERVLHEKLSEDFFLTAKKNSDTVSVYRIIYLSNKKKIAGFIVEPKNSTGKLPCIIYNRGGSRDFGAIKLGNLFGSIAEFAKRGYVVIASNYAGSPGSDGVDDFGGKTLADILNLYKILKQYPPADITRIGMYGWSRGAAMTHMCLAKARWIKAAVVGAGPTDEVSAPRFRKGWREHQISLYGKSRAEQIKRSALYWPEKFSKKTPILIIHGTADWRVNPLDSIKLAEKLYEQKVPFRLVMFEGADHSVSEYKSEVKRLTYDWFERFVKNKEKLPNLKPHGK
ncbi:MAG: peptidase [Parcubacteria group bacterium Gr01-1014_17]|nr:MAG: peptidase [Parcubacteria group bacterium Gr01-1014_17]